MEPDALLPQPLNARGKKRSGSANRSGYASELVVKGKKRGLVGTGRFELPTPRTPSECSTRLSHVPTEGFGRERGRGV